MGTHAYWLSAKEVARVLDVNVRTVRRWEALGKIPKAVRIGARWVRWVRAEVDAFVKQRGAGAKPS